MNTILPFDEINALEYTLPAYFQDGKIKPNLLDTLLDALEDLFLLSYALGSDDANRQMNSEIRPTIEEVMDTVDAGWRWECPSYFCQYLGCLSVHCRPSHPGATVV